MRVMRYNIIGTSDLYEVVGCTGNVLELEPVGFYGENIFVAVRDLYSVLEDEKEYPEESLFGEPID